MTNNGPSWRRVDLDGVGAIEVRRPTLRDVTTAQSGDVAWWHKCVRIGGEELSHDACLEMDADVANAIASEVMKKHPTQPPSGGCSGSCRRQKRTRN